MAGLAKEHEGGNDTTSFSDSCCDKYIESY